MKKVFTAHNPIEAHFVRGLLESHGVPATVRGEDLWGARGQIPVNDAWPTVWILDADREAEARDIVRVYDSGAAARGPVGAVWRCRTCNEVLEPQFTTCWNCGTDRGR